MRHPTSYTGLTLGGRYVLGELLGTGGFGAVYKAVQSDLGRTVAVKILHADAVLAGDGLARFAREAHAAAALGHPNIAQVTDFQVQPGEPPFIVLEYLDGLTLGALLGKQPRLEAERVCAIAHQVLSALDVAHGAGIVHRDVKPDNVFLVSLPGLEDFVKLLDFGIAKLTTAKTALTELGTMLGTPAFMAPEQVSNVDVDHRADLYSVGALMHYALSGKHAFDAPNMSALLYAIVYTPVPALSSIDPQIDPRLSAVVGRAMHKDPAARFASAAEMRAALEPWSMKAPRVGMTTTASPASLVPSTVPRTAPTYPTAHTPSFAPPHGPGPLAPTLDEPRSMSMPAPMRPPQPPPSKGIGGILMLVGGALALFAVLIAGGIVLYVMHGRDSDESLATSNPMASATAATPAAVVPTGTPTAPRATPGAAPGTAPKGGVAPAPTAPRADAGGLPSPSPSPSPAPAPAPAPGGKMAARSASVSLGDCTFDAAECNAAIGKVMPSVQGCFAATELDPPNHEVADYSINLDSAGTVTGVSRNRSGGNVPHPKLDACIGSAIRKAKYPRSPGNTRVEVLFRARL